MKFKYFIGHSFECFVLGYEELFVLSIYIYILSLVGDKICGLIVVTI
jgi:hypothetical protein